MAAMKRSERRLLEEKMRYVVMEDITFDMERDQQTLEKLKPQIMQQHGETDAKPARRHGIGRRVLIVSAAAVFLVVMSFGIAVLMPESVSHARGFVRTAAIWVNNTLHLGYEFEEPVEKAEPSEDKTAYRSFEEAVDDIPYPLVYFDTPDFELQSIDLLHESPFEQIVILYQKESQKCLIRLDHVADSTFTDLDSNTYTLIPWQCGELYCWEGPLTHYAITYYAGMEITISTSNVAYDDFVTLCHTLKSIN